MRSRNGAPSQKGCMVKHKRMQATKEYAPPTAERGPRPKIENPAFSNPSYKYRNKSDSRYLREKTKHIPTDDYSSW